MTNQTAGAALDVLVKNLRGISRDLVEGACADPDVDPDWFYAEGNQFEQAPAVMAAKRTCIGCGIRAQCLAGAMERREAWGVWGGLSTKERERLRRRSA